MQDVYINSLSAFLPNEAVPSEDIEKFLGEIDSDNMYLGGIRNRILRINGIEHRYYALDTEMNPTHLSEEMLELASIEALSKSSYTIQDVDLLSFGTTHGDLIVPSITHMALGRLGKRGMGSIAIAPTSGVCLSSIFSMKTAELHIKTGEKQVALVGGVERPSVTMRACHYYAESITRNVNKKYSRNYNFMHTAFLRWMLSDGCGVAVMSNQQNPRGPTLKVDWIEITSYANEYPTCMYSGTNIREDFLPTDTWWAQPSIEEAASKGMIVLRQDPNTLKKFITLGGTREIKRIINAGKLNPSEIKLFLPHLSSMAFKPEILAVFQQEEIDLGEEKWFTNLPSKGNTGAAAIYVMLDEAMNRGLITKGDKVLLMVPESARFTYGFVQLSCV